MVTSFIKNTQAAVDAIAHSPHPTNKVAAAIAGTDAQGNPFLIAKPNYWPAIIEKHFGQSQKIGNSSGTIHAETACILAAPKTEGADLFITDPPCPNCMKNIAEAGIKNIYIDHKGFDKDFAKRRGHHFENMSMRICEKAGINLFQINRKEESLTPILEISKDYTPGEENPAFISKLAPDMNNDEIWKQKIAESEAIYKDDPFALCLAQNDKNETFYIIARTHPTIGYTTDTMEETKGESGQSPVREDKTRGESACKAVREILKDNKYSFILQPINRLLMNVARHGLTILPEYIYSSRTPTSREFVNMIGAEQTTLTIGNKTKARDEHGLQALERLTDANILTDRCAS